MGKSSERSVADPVQIRRVKECGNIVMNASFGAHYGLTSLGMISENLGL